MWCLLECIGTFFSTVKSEVKVTSRQHLSVFLKDSQGQLRGADLPQQGGLTRAYIRWSSNILTSSQLFKEQYAKGLAATSQIHTNM